MIAIIKIISVVVVVIVVVDVNLVVFFFSCSNSNNNLFSASYPFPAVAASVDRLYVSRSSVICPTVRADTFPPFSPPHPSPNVTLAFLRFFGLPIYLPGLIPPVFGLFYLFEIVIQFASVPDVTPSYSAMD